MRDDLTTPVNRTTWVLARRADRWYVAAYHTSPEE
jgi:hypothetical protein